MRAPIGVDPPHAGRYRVREGPDGLVRRHEEDAGVALDPGEALGRDVPLVFRFESADEYWSFLTEVAGALAAVISALPESHRHAVRRTIEDRLGPFRTDGGYALPGLCLNVVTS